MEKTVLHDKQFRISITENEIQLAVARVAEEINADFNAKEILFIAVLNGSFMFAAELMKRITVKCRISFVKIASYEGTQSRGTVAEIIGLSESLKGKSVILIEDIIDTGNTLSVLVDMMARKEAKKVKVASLLLKPDAYKGKYNIDYVGFRIPNRFVVGYGLDYDGLGRNLPAIYELAD